MNFDQAEVIAGKPRSKNQRHRLAARVEPGHAVADMNVRQRKQLWNSGSLPRVERPRCPALPPVGAQAGTGNRAVATAGAAATCPYFLQAGFGDGGYGCRTAM